MMGLTFVACTVFLLGSVILEGPQKGVSPHKDVVAEALPHDDPAPKTLVLQSSGLPGFPQPEVSVKFLCKDWTDNFSCQPIRTCFCLETTCSFHQKKKMHMT